MYDIKFIRENPDLFDAQLKRRGESPAASKILEIDAKRRALIAQAEAALAKRNAASKEVGAAKARGDEEEFARLRGEVAQRKEEIAGFERDADAQDAALRELLLQLPNAPYEDVPDGVDEGDNVELKRVGVPREFDFEAREHFEIDAVKPGMDFETAARLSCARFMLLSGAVAAVHRALAQFMLTTHVTKNGLTEVWTPVLVRPDAMLGTGQLPKFAEDSYQTTNGWWLIPTAEVPLTNIVAGQIVEKDYLPRRYVAHSQCFRSEAGSAGRDTAGMLRQHQFEKVEMVSITRPEDSRAELERMTACAEGILEALELPYRTIVLCTGDMGFGARRTHDIEVWLPGQQSYREISSVSVCGDFQARRMNARYRPQAGAKPEFVHTLNGSGLAVGRCLIAVLENGQQADGSVNLPPCLSPFLGGASQISAAGELR